jgi:hypothetical protein
MARRVVAYALLFTLCLSAMMLRTPGLVASAQSGVHVSLAATQAATDPVMRSLSSLVERIYLPFVMGRPPSATLQFAASVNETTGELLTSSERFASGTDLVFITWRLEGFQNRQYSVELTFPNDDTLTTTVQTVPTSDDRNFTNFCRTSSASCTSERLALLPGVYTARLFVDNQIVSEQQMVIE